MLFVANPTLWVPVYALWVVAMWLPSLVLQMWSVLFLRSVDLAAVDSLGGSPGYCPGSSGQQCGLRTPAAAFDETQFTGKDGPTSELTLCFYRALGSNIIPPLVQRTVCLPSARLWNIWRCYFKREIDPLQRPFGRSLIHLGLYKRRPMLIQLFSWLESCNYQLG